MYVTQTLIILPIKNIWCLPGFDFLKRMWSSYFLGTLKAVRPLALFGIKFLQPLFLKRTRILLNCVSGIKFLQVLFLSLTIILLKCLVNIFIFHFVKERYAQSSNQVWSSLLSCFFFRNSITAPKVFSNILASICLHGFTLGFTFTVTAKGKFLTGLLHIPYQISQA